MMKKWLSISIMAGFICWASYRFFFTRDISQTKPINSMALDWDELDSTTGSPVSEIPQTIKLAKKIPTSQDESQWETLTGTKAPNEIASDDQFAEFEKTEQRWLTKVQKIFDEKQYQRYLFFRDKNEKEKLEAYKSFHKDLKRKFGEKYSYNISEDQNLAEKKLNQHYLQNLLHLVGEKKFQEYIEARDAINEELRRKDQGFLQIEF